MFWDMESHNFIPRTKLNDNGFLIEMKLNTTFTRKERENCMNETQITIHRKGMK
jgi:hypothetical protein